MIAPARARNKQSITLTPTSRPRVTLHSHPRRHLPARMWTNASEPSPRSAYAPDDFDRDRIREIFHRLRQDAPHRLLALSQFQEDEALRIRRAVYGYRRRAAHPLTALDNPGVDIAFACFTRALVPERCGAPCPNSIATCFPRERKSDCSRALSVARSPNSSRALGPPTRSSVSNWNCGAHGARGRENSTRSGAPSWRKSRRPRKRVQSGSESKSADRSIAPKGLRPTKARNSEGAGLLLDRNFGRATLPAIAGQVLAGISADRAAFGGEQAKDLRNPAAPAAKSRMDRAIDPLRDSFSSSSYLQAAWLVTAQKARTFEVVRRSVPPDCGAEMFVGDQHRRLSVALSWRETLRGYRHPSASWPLAQRGEVHAVVGADEAEVSSRRRRSPRSDALEKGGRTHWAIKIGRPKRTRALGKASRVLRASHFLKILVSRQHWAASLSPSPAHPLGYARP